MLCCRDLCVRIRVVRPKPDTDPTITKKNKRLDPIFFIYLTRPKYLHPTGYGSKTLLHSILPVTLSSLSIP